MPTLLYGLVHEHLEGPSRYFLHGPKCWYPVSAGLMPTEARGNYLPEAPYLRETKTYLNYMHASESTLDSGMSGTASHSSRHDMLAIISSRYQYGPFLFFVADVMSNYLTTDGLKNFLYFRRLPEARGICHICHMVNPALTPV